MLFPENMYYVQCMYNKHFQALIFLAPTFAQCLLLIIVKFIYSEKATKFCEISTVDLSPVVPVKSTLEILQIFRIYEL